MVYLFETTDEQKQNGVIVNGVLCKFRFQDTIPSDGADITFDIYMSDFDFENPID